MRHIYRCDSLKSHVQTSQYCRYPAYNNIHKSIETDLVLEIPVLYGQECFHDKHLYSSENYGLGRYWLSIGPHVQRSLVLGTHTNL